MAREQDEPGSDIALLVAFDDEASVLDEVALRIELRHLLQVDVDVVAEDFLRGALRERILAEAVPATRQKALDAAEGVVCVCEVLLEMITVGFDAFVADRRTQWAVEMGLIRIGEGVNRTSTTTWTLGGYGEPPPAMCPPCAIILWASSFLT